MSALRRVRDASFSSFPGCVAGSGRPIGAVAQLGERLLCKQEVVGSIPSGSTNLLIIWFRWKDSLFFTAVGLLCVHWWVL